MIFKDALRALKDSGSKAVFYTLTYYLTSALMFLFFNMAESSTLGETEIYVNAQGQADASQYLSSGNIGNIMMVLIVIFCAVDIVFTNDFYVKNQAQDIGIRMISGATFMQCAGYLLIQTFLMLIVAIPLGILTGWALIPVFNQMLIAQGSDLVIAVQPFAVTEYTIVMLFIIGITTVLNMSFAYKNAAALLFTDALETLDRKERTFGSFGSGLSNSIFMKVLWVVIWLCPIPLFFVNSSAMMLLCFLGIIGFAQVLPQVICPFLTRKNRKKTMEKPIHAVALGFLRQDLMLTKTTIYLFLTDTTVLLCMRFMRDSSFLEIMLIMVSYIVVAVLQGLTVMFRLETGLAGRSRDLAILNQTGFQKEQVVKAARLEIAWYYLFIIVVTLFYMIPMMSVEIMNGSTDSMTAMILIAVSIIPLLFVWILTLFYYKMVQKSVVTTRMEAE